MYYLDANAVLYSSIYTGEKASGAESLIRRIATGELSGATASLTLDEVVWILSRYSSRKSALDQGRRILAFPRVQILDVEARHMVTMIRFLDRYDALTPRDAVHLSVMDAHGIRAIASDDHDFDAVSEVDRHGLETFDDSN